MNKKSFLKIVLLMLVFVIVQTYFQNTKDFQNVVSKWTGYFIPLIWAVFISILLDPFITYLQKRFNIKIYLAIFLALLVIIAIIMGIFLVIIPQFVKAVHDVNEIYPYILEKVSNISKKYIDYLSSKDINVANIDEITESITTWVKNNFSGIQRFALSVLVNMVWWTVGITNFFLGLVLAVLILINKKSHIKTKNNLLFIIFGEKKAEYISKKLDDSRKIFLDYILGKIIVSFVVGIVVFLILYFTKTPYATLSAVLLGLGNMIPYIGSIVGGVISALLIFIVAPYKVIFLLIAIGASQLVDGFIIGPKIIGKKVGLSSFWVIVSMIIFGGLFGIVGMFLGVPLMCIIKLFYQDILKFKKEEKK